MRVRRGREDHGADRRHASAWAESITPTRRRPEASLALSVLARRPPSPSCRSRAAPATGTRGHRGRTRCIPRRGPTRFCREAGDAGCPRPPHRRCPGGLGDRGGSAPRARPRDSSSDRGAEPQEYRAYSEVRQRRAGGEDPASTRSDFRHGLLGVVGHGLCTVHLGAAVTAVRAASTAPRSRKAGTSGRRARVTVIPLVEAGLVAMARAEGQPGPFERS